ncbi:Transglycosylase SLT domain-containing protein [Roseateles sp. YR242]|uniref:transglycosylase SLT domain-containing protein n=1 Tax=Roseateles sp. YR242 TaxID=1855305 RepID=UPI0008D15277|nr:transglycosylase SLT domain-containing protein [Roseateles sp. YR242]SEK64797.1 Transglycosylase SLT domain-containing protein [Roseateles sp. YR242]
MVGRVQVVEGEIGTVYYCDLDQGVYEVTGKNTSKLVTDPDKIAAGQGVRISNWQNFKLENDPSGRPAGTPAQPVGPNAPPIPGGGGQQAPGASTGSEGSGVNGDGGTSGASSGRTPEGMPKELWDYCVEAGQKTNISPYILAAQMERESNFGRGLQGSPSAGDGLMQVEPGTRSGYMAKFREQMGHGYDHGNPRDQVEMAAVILRDKGGSIQNMLQKYNGGDNWHPGATDSYGREIHADAYASAVMSRARQMQAGG